MLIKIWFSLISGILFISLVLLLSSFKLFNIFYWLWLLILITASAITIVVYLEQPKDGSKQLEKTYSDFLKEKDKQIEELQNKGSLLFKTTMKKAEKDLELDELKRRLEEKANP